MTLPHAPGTEDALPVEMRSTLSAGDGEPEAPGSREAGPVRRWGHFVLLSQLGEGGMGEVYAAYDERLDRKVAIKLLRAAGESEAARRRLLREAQALARIAHPNVVGVHEVGDLDGEVFIAMEHIDGETLRDWQARAPRTVAEILEVYAEALRGLAAVHAAGLVHRDFKPANVMLSRDGRVRLVDFGLAHGRGAEPAEVDQARLSEALAGKLTVTGAIVGTPAYMSPEQLLGAPLDARSDQYSFCVALFEALYGRHPVAGHPMERLVAAVEEAGLAASPARKDVPAHVQRAIVRGLSRSPDERWPDAMSLLGELATDPPVNPSEHGRRRLVFGALTVLLCVAVVLAGDEVVKHDDPVGLLIQMLLMALVGSSVLVVAMLVFRRTLMRNPFHRTMALTALIIALGVTASRACGLALQESAWSVIMRDLMILAAAAAVPQAWAPKRRWHGWLPPLIPALAVLWIVTISTSSEVVATMGVNGAYLAFLLHWHLASRAAAAGSDGGTSRSSMARSGFTSLSR